MRCAAIVLALLVVACSDDVEVTRLPGSPSTTRALTWFDDGAPIAIGGDSEFGLAYLQTPDGDTWKRADSVPAFDVHAQLMRGGNDIFAISEAQVHRWERAPGGGGFAWNTIAIPFGTTADTAFGVDDTGHIFAVSLEPDGAGAVFGWRTDTNRWEEILMTRPIGIGAEHFTVSPDGNSVAWSVPGVGLSWVDRIANARTEIACTDPALGACVASIRDLTLTGHVLSALVCDDEVNGMRAVVSITETGVGPSYTFSDAVCRSLDSVDYGTRLIVGDSVYILQNPDDGLVEITDVDPELTYVLRDPATAFAYGDGIYRIDF